MKKKHEGIYIHNKTKLRLEKYVEKECLVMQAVASKAIGEFLKSPVNCSLKYNKDESFERVVILADLHSRLKKWSSKNGVLLKEAATVAVNEFLDSVS